MPPNPPLQVDWVILQRFAYLEDAQRWLGSTERQTRIEGVSADAGGPRRRSYRSRRCQCGAKPAPVSAVISTRVKPGKEAEYLKWERKIAAAQSKAPGLQGYRFEPPVPGVQEDFVAILRFDSEANCRPGWTRRCARSWSRKPSLLTEEFHARMAQRGFEQWFRDEPAGGAAPSVRRGR